MWRLSLTAVCCFSRAALGHQKVAQAIVASKMAPAQRYIHQQYWKNQREVQKQAQQRMQRMARSLDVPNRGASRTRGRHGSAQALVQQLMQVSWALRVGRSLQSMGRSLGVVACCRRRPQAPLQLLQVSSPQQVSCTVVGLGQCAVWARATHLFRMLPRMHGLARHHAGAVGRLGSPVGSRLGLMAAGWLQVTSGE